MKIHTPYDSHGRHIDLIVLHSSATPRGMDIGVKEISQWHRQRGWLGCGYHYVVRQSGVVEWGRDLSEVGAHAAGYNRNSIGVCLIGGVDKWENPQTGQVSLIPNANFTPIQLDVTAELLKLLHREYPNADILGHKDLEGAKTKCPSMDVREFCKEAGIYGGS